MKIKLLKIGIRYTKKTSKGYRESYILIQLFYDQKSHPIYWKGRVNIFGENEIINISMYTYYNYVEKKSVKVISKSKDITIDTTVCEVFEKVENHIEEYTS